MISNIPEDLMQDGSFPKGTDRPSYKVSLLSALWRTLPSSPDLPACKVSLPLVLLPSLHLLN